MSHDQAYSHAEKKIKDVLRTKDSVLYLSDYGLTKLPPSLEQLTHLQSLYLSNNKLTDLPPFIAKFRYLRKLELDDNPLNPELADAYEKGVDAVKTYLRAKGAKSKESHKLKVFLCHASQDKPVVHELYQKLVAEDWIEPWLDAKKLLPGQDWRAEIKNAVETADSVIIFLSNTSINKDGFIQKELRLAKDVALEKSEGSLFLIPIRLDDCKVPKSLENYHWADYFGNEHKQTYRRLLEALSLRLTDLKRKEAIGR